MHTKLVLEDRDGAQIPVDFSAGPICDERERVAAEQRLVRSEQRFRSVFDNAPLGLALIDCGNRYVLVNRVMCARSGRLPSSW